jgi:hypothetical protein
MKSGDIVEFIVSSPQQIQWSNTDSSSYLIIGRRYVVKEVFIHWWYTKITLYHKSGTFNSVHFKKIL